MALEKKNKTKKKTHKHKHKHTTKKKKHFMMYGLKTWDLSFMGTTFEPIRRIPLVELEVWNVRKMNDA